MGVSSESGCSETGALQVLAPLKNLFAFNMCRYKTAWRKRTRIATSTLLAGCRKLCRGGHSHVVLRGRNRLHKCSWTRLAQVYPQAMAYMIWLRRWELVWILRPRRSSSTLAAAPNVPLDELARLQIQGQDEQSEFLVIQQFYKALPWWNRPHNSCRTRSGRILISG